MRRQRWQHLDRDLKPSVSPPENAAPATPQQSSPSRPAVPPSILTAARGYFHLRDYHACIETLVGADHSHDMESARLLGLSLGYVSDPRAVEVLERALTHCPGDLDLRASLLSAQLRSDDLPTDLHLAARGPLGELTAAALWLRGRRDLQRGNAHAAASAFTRAAILFASESPAAEKPLRTGASYVAAAISHLLGGDSDAAQNAYVSIVRDASPQLRTFANTLHALGEELRGSSEAERREALTPLVELVTSTQLHAGFYGRPGPVDLQWSGSELAALTGYRRQGG